MINKKDIIGIIIMIVLGSIAHFVYNILPNPIIKLFFPCNESVFEHTKLYPIPLIFTLLLIKLFSKEKINIYAYSISLVMTLLYMISMHYTIKGVFGNCPLVCDLLIFVTSIILLFTFKNKIKYKNNIVGICIFTFIIATFIMLTIYPFDIPIFIDYSKK